MQLPATVRPVIAPMSIVLFTVLAASFAPALPAGYTGLRTAGPYAVLVTATAVAWWFNRGRAFVIALSLLAGYAGYHVFPSKAVYTALVVIVPVNCLLAMFKPERGARYRAAHRWIALLLIEALIVTWIGAAGRSAFSGTWWNELLATWPLRSPPTPLVGRLMFAAAFAAALRRAWPEHTPVQVGNAGAIAAFFIAAEFATTPGIYAAFMTAAGAILIVALLQESHRLAFRDELTGLPGRRALEERLRSLGERYAIAMVDVDHFKQFNDQHGHDIGDQVLKLVGARLAQVSGGGIAYRYGGEEFAVLFPGRGLHEALIHLEALRASIESYRMAVRGADRPRKAEDGITQRRHARANGATLSLTVSIGAAEPSARTRSPSQVIKAADEALYRAKQEGRNKVSK